jgi:hypothetical protein
LAENPPAPTQASTEGVAIGNPRDVQGIIGIAVVGGALAIAGVAIATGTNALQVLDAILPLAGTIVGFYYGQKSQQ